MLLTLHLNLELYLYSYKANKRISHLFKVNKTLAKVKATAMKLIAVKVIAVKVTAILGEKGPWPQLILRSFFKISRKNVGAREPSITRGCS